MKPEINSYVAVFKKTDLLLNIPSYAYTYLDLCYTNSVNVLCHYCYINSCAAYKATMVVFNLFCQPIKSLLWLLETKCVFKQQDLQQFGPKLNEYK